MKAPTGLAMLLRALGVQFDAEEVERVLASAIAEVPAVIAKLESMKQTFESIDRRLSAIESILSLCQIKPILSGSEIWKEVIGGGRTNSDSDSSGARPGDGWE
jgi:hypothetical protein